MEYKDSDTERLSAIINWIRFPLIFFIIFLHCHSVVRLEGDHEVYFKTLYPFALWLGETGVPAFFFISGYLFFISKKTYEQKIRNRFHTLFIPYILWNLVFLICYLFVFALGYPQYINYRNIADYSFLDYLRLFWDRGSFDNGNFVPLLCPLWYIRNLLIMSILSPFLYYLIRYGRELFLGIVAIWWIMTYHNAFIPQTILFFCLGAYFPILRINLLKIIQKKGIILSLFFTFGLFDIITHTLWSTPINLQIHRVSILFNIPAFFLLADFCYHHGIRNKSLPNAAFIVFCVHYPIVVALRKGCIAVFSDASDFTHILLYFICVIVATFLSIATFLMLNRFFPNVKNVLSGNR